MASQTMTSRAELDQRKAQGKAALNANQMEVALHIYARILRDYPEDVESYLVMGDCYLADGDPDTALLLYSQALEHAPQDVEVHRRIRLVRAERADHWDESGDMDSLSLIRESSLPTNPEAVGNMLREITKQVRPVTEGEVLKAAQLLDEIIHSPKPAKAVAERLHEIDQLLPALLELNIRQARADGRPDLADSLQSLLKHIQLQIGSTQSKQVRTETKLTSSASELHILVLGEEYREPSFLSWVPLDSLTALGCKLTTCPEGKCASLEGIDLVLAQSPHVDQGLMDVLAAAHACHIPIVLNLSVDLEQMPIVHPSYEKMGLSTPAHAKAYTAALLLADMICTPSESLASSLRSAGYRASSIPPGWLNIKEKNTRKAAERLTLNLGWVGLPGEVEDVFQIRRIIVRVLREFPQLRLVVAGEPEVYQLFDNLPEPRRMFIPIIGSEDMVSFYSQVDILIVPLRNIPYNRALSDERVLEAGVSGVPWVASPIPAFVVWEAGGLIANTPDEWHTYLRQLAMDAELRQTLGASGRQKAEARKSDLLGKHWIDLFREVIDTLE